MEGEGARDREGGIKKLGGAVGENARAPSAPTLPTQGQMDEDVQRILSQILQMQRLQAQGPLRAAYCPLPPRPLTGARDSCLDPHLETSLGPSHCFLPPPAPACTGKSLNPALTTSDSCHQESGLSPPTSRSQMLSGIKSS